MNPIQDIALIEQLSTLLGLNNWQLNQGQYNGCSFSSITSLGGGLSNTAIANVINGASYVVNQFIGQNATDPNNNLPLANLALPSVNDKLRRKLVRKDLPYSNQDNIEDMGLNGWSFRLDVLFYGANYLSALNNFLTCLQSPNLEVENTLVHPVYGLITGDVYLAEMDVKYSSDMFQAVLLELQFEAEQSLAWIPTPLNYTQIAAEALTALLVTIGAVGEAISLADAISL